MTRGVVCVCECVVNTCAANPPVLDGLSRAAALNVSGLLDVCARAPTNANVSFESGAMALLPSPLTTAFFGALLAC